MKEKIAAAHESVSAAHDSLNAAAKEASAAAKDAAAAALEAAAELKNTVKDYFPTGKTKEKSSFFGKDKTGKDKEKSSFFSSKDKTGKDKEKSHFFSKDKHQDKHQDKHHDKHDKHDKHHHFHHEKQDKHHQEKHNLFGFKHHEKEHHHITDYLLPDKTRMLTFFAMPYMAVMIALIVVLLSALFFMKRRQIMSTRPAKTLMSWIQQKRISKSSVLICGPADAGKTLLFHTLAGSQFQPTQTSMEENINTFKINEKLLGESKKDKLKNINFQFIDFPGHPSQEMKLDKFMNNLQGVIVLVDASSFDSINNGAKTLNSLMERKGFLSRKTPVLICANKIDLDISQSMASIREKMLDELNKLRQTQPSMETTEKQGDITSSVGKTERLNWDNLGLSVSFGQISAKQGNVTDVLDFLEGIQCC